jgi:hypothetical protein
LTAFTPAQQYDYTPKEYSCLSEECYFDASGKPVLSNNTASCDIMISGIDNQVRVVEKASVKKSVSDWQVPRLAAGKNDKWQTQ